ncbi:MAG: glycosyltransferase [Bacteroidales bacterium]|nr:glycosyltransferase [Bacteroidales bacterium]
MPTVLQINSCANWGSTGKIAEQINQAAAHRGWKTYLAYGREVNPSQSELIHVGNKASQAIALAEARLFDNDGLSNRRATQRLVKTIMAIKPDIIHLHNLHGYYINYRILFEYLNTTNIPVVWTLHDCWTFTGHCAHFVEVDCGKWINGCERCPLKKSYPTSWGFDRSSRNFQLKKQSFASNKNLHLIAVSQWLAGFVKHSFFHNVDLRVINNGIDLNVFKPTKFEKKKKFRILGVSSVWTRSKGLFDVFRLRELLNEDEFEIMLVGLSDEQIKSLPQGVMGIARTNSVEELVDYYSSADVFVNPTYGDTFPTTNLEALACGTPVITYRTGGSPESVGVETGMIVEQGDVSAIVDAVKTVQSLGKTHFANACRNRAEQLYNREERYNEYVELYEKLIAER